MPRSCRPSWFVHALQAAAFGWVACGASGALAEPPPEPDWEVGLGVYGWLTAMDLEVGGRDRVTGDDATRHFHTDLGDAFSDWNGGGGGYVDARWRRIVGLIDGAWVQTDHDSDGYQASTLVDAKIGFRAVDIRSPFSESNALDAPRLHLDLLAGARYHESNADPQHPNANPFDTDEVRDSLSPVVGLRWSIGLVPNLSLATVADIGGFDVGEASHLTWSVNPRLNYRAFDHLDLFVGWKHLYDDRDGDLEINISGPQAGIGWSF